MKNKLWIINFVDIIILAVLVLAAIVLSNFFFADSAKIDFVPKQAVSLTLRVNDIPLKHDGLIRNGDTVYLENRNDGFGKIKRIDYSKATVEFTDKLTNTATTYKSPDKLNALILVECEALVTDDGNIFINDLPVQRGDMLQLCSPDYAFEATVINSVINKD